MMCEWYDGVGVAVEECADEAAVDEGTNVLSSRSSGSTRAEPKTDPRDDIADGEGVSVVRVEGGENAGTADVDAVGVGCCCCCCCC